jgi:sec-independent protein translocase protein TatA
VKAAQLSLAFTESSKKVRESFNAARDGGFRNHRLRSPLMPNIGPMELVIVLVIALLILGPKRFPETGRSLGRGMREFKDSIRGVGDKDKALAVAPDAQD